jgi:predicted DNA-binding protein
VKKTSVYLNDEEIARLEWLAEHEGISQAEIIRKAISRYVPKHSDRDYRLIASADGPGDSVADHAEEELLTGFGE